MTTLPGRDVTVTIMHHYPEGLDGYNGKRGVNVLLISKGSELKVSWVIGKRVCNIIPVDSMHIPKLP